MTHDSGGGSAGAQAECAKETERQACTERGVGSGGGLQHTRRSHCQQIRPESGRLERRKWEHQRQRAYQEKRW
jgi:hypothetical protein